jgi:ureidoacrylate peracid hydrolase
MLMLNAKPAPLEIDLRKAAVVAVDMQNAFVTQGGMLDIAGVDISGAAQVVRSIKEIVGAGRRAGIPIVFLQMGYKPDLSNSGGPGSPNYHKELAMHLMNCRPQLKGQLLTEGSWDFEIVDELKPEPQDIVIVKSRYSGFQGTTLDSQLRMLGVRFLFLAGIATNVCVESTLRHGYLLDYWPLLIADATMQAGPPAMQEATLFNVESFFGWTVQAEEFLAVLLSSHS